MPIGVPNDSFTLVEVPLAGSAGHDVYGTPQLTSTVVDVETWFEEVTGETSDVGGGTKRFDAVAIGPFDSNITEQAVLTLGSDGTKWKVVERRKIQGLPGPSACTPEKRIELRLERQRG